MRDAKEKENKMNDTIKEMMTRYNEAKEAWINFHGEFNEADFHAWFTEQVGA